MPIDISTLGLYLATLLFCVGFLIIIIKKNLIFVLIGVELILNAANLNLVIFSQQDAESGGMMLAIFTVAVAAAEAVIALALLINVYKYYKTSDLDQLNKLGR